MRIIRGAYRGRQIIAPKSLPVRPTTDYAKEGLFNILENLIVMEEIVALDLFSGTGSITYEFASRGCQGVTAVDANFQCTSFIKRTKEQLGFNNVSVVRADVFRYLKTCAQTFDIIFADPPYALEGIDQLPGLVLEANLLKKNGLLILEHAESYSFAMHPYFFQHRNYGAVNFSFFRNTL